MKRVISWLMLALLVMGIPFLACGVNSVKSVEDSWWNANWKYRMPLVIINPSNESLIKCNVSLTLNTSELVKERKVRPDYGDIRFTFYNSTTGKEENLTEFWMEGYSDSYVSFWIQLDYVPPKSNVTVYMYYGNPDACYAGIRWNGVWFAYTNSSIIPEGFNESLNIYGRFPLANNTFGVLGGSATHTHILSGTTSVYQTHQVCGSWAYEVRVCGSHSHCFTVTTDPAPNYPPYYTLKLLNKTSNIFLLKDFIVYANSSEIMNLNDCYEIFRPGIGYFLLPNATVGKIGGTEPHTHTFSGETSTKWGDDGYMYFGSYLAGDHYHRFSGTTDSAIIMPRYYNLTPLYVKKNFVPLDTGITLMATSVPPIGWKLLKVSDRFIRCSMIPGGQGGGNHYHNFTFRTGYAVCLSMGGGNFYGYYVTPVSHTHTAEGVSSCESDDPPYISVLYIVRDKTPVEYLIGEEQRGPNIAVTKLIPAKRIVGQNCSAKILIEISNYGSFTENFNLTVYTNTTVMFETEMTLLNASSITLIIIWNTTGFAKGNYTIWAFIEPVPSEVNLTDNIFFDGFVIVSLIGDVTGSDGWPDGKVDIMDVANVAILFGVNYPDPKYNPNYDLTGETYGVPDGKIDIADVALVAIHYGEIDP